MSIDRLLPARTERPLFDAAATRAIERSAQAQLPPSELMRRAGRGVARLALAVAPHARRVWIAAGPGNNGGDGLEAAIHLAEAGRDVRVALLADAARLPSDAAAALARAQAAGIDIECAAVSFDATALRLAGEDLAIDALLGIGASRPPTGAMAACIERLNAVPCSVLAVDVPSGLDASTGQLLGDVAVVAHDTLTFLTAKTGLFTGSGRTHAGTVWLDALGVEADAATPAARLGAAPSPRRTPRGHAGHKGTFGDVTVVGGAPGMTGAALLAARAALAGGAGRVFVELLGDDARPSVDVLHPELMLRRAGSRNDRKTLAESTVVCGCGGSEAIAALLPPLLSGAGRLVVDADALNAIAADASLQRLLSARAGRGLATVLTPHPLEAARLLQSTTPAVQGDRLRAALALVDRFHAAVVLKGSGSIVAAEDDLPIVNSTGNASLATAGTGDVLAGWIGGRWSEASGSNLRASAFAVAASAVAEHGAAADDHGGGRLTASALIEALRSR